MSKIKSDTSYGRITATLEKSKEIAIRFTKMKGARSLSVVLAFLILAFVLAAQPRQEKGLKVNLLDNVSISAPATWRLSNQSRDSVAIYVPLKKGRPVSSGSESKDNPKPAFVIASEAGMLVTVEHRRDHAEAVRRLAEIASEYPERATTTIIAGWPAIDRRYRSLMPQLGENELTGGNVETSFATTAVAVATTVIQFNTMLAPDADPKLLDEALGIARTLRAPEGNSEVSQRELYDIQKMIRPPRTFQQQAPGGSKVIVRGGREPGVAVQVQNGNGELEVASNDGQHVVVAANSGFSFSNNFGGTYVVGGNTPCNQVSCDGDPSLAVGQSGNIYYAWIGGPTGNSRGDGVSRSTDNGQTFPFRGMAATCPGTTGCTSADQEHIAADRNNASGSGEDRVYNVWRDFGTPFSLRISCSTDSAATWTGGVAIAAGDFPRVSVGSDGFVYVGWASGGNMMLHKYSNCNAGLAPQVGWPVTVAAFSTVACPVAGLDRCNGRNLLSSPRVAVDDLDPAHIYYAFATSTAAGNEDVMVFDSVNAGKTFLRSVRINNAVAGRRFMPWISTYGGIAVVSWYDRRTATVGNNDRTRFYIGGAAVRGPNLVALAEADLSGNDDAQCSTWQCATNAITDSEGCSNQPQLGGRCQTAMGGGSNTACDFSSTVCPGGETCRIGRGCPKYGDYNGNAAALGRHFSAWSSAVPPVSVGGAAGAIRVFASADRIPSDFYVRDWNDNATTFDNGAQPSTHDDFWSTSDLWSQSTNVVAMPGPDGSVLGDPPTRIGPNFVYARVSRRAAAMSTAAAAPVTVNFYLGDYGLGAPFVLIGSETVTFAAGDMTKITPAHAWTVPVGSVVHLCIAAQIVGPDGDTFSIPSVAGIAPGPANALITDDNNKAQRNLQDLVGDGAGTELMAMIRNQGKVKRLMQLRIKLPPDVRVRGVVDTIGGESVELTNDGRIVLGELAPGEIRWLRFRFSSLEGLDKPTPIVVFEDNKRPSNGFTIMVHRGPLEDVARRDLIAFAGVLTRLAQVEGAKYAKEQAAIALRESLKVSEESYIDYLSNNHKAIEQIIITHLRASTGSDPFDLSGALKDLSNAIDQKNAGGMTVAQTAITERLDAHLTVLMRQRGHGRLRP